MARSLSESGKKVIEEHEKGITTVKGKVVYDESGRPIKLSDYEAGLQLVGFRPERVTEVQGERRIAENVKRHYAEQRERLYGKYRLADEDERSKVLKEIQRYNLNVSKYRGGVPKITRESQSRNMSKCQGSRADPFLSFSSLSLFLLAGDTVELTAV